MYSQCEVCSWSLHPSETGTFHAREGQKVKGWDRSGKASEMTPWGPAQSYIWQTWQNITLSVHKGLDDRLRNCDNETLLIATSSQQVINCRHMQTVMRICLYCCLCRKSSAQRPDAADCFIDPTMVTFSIITAYLHQAVVKVRGLRVGGSAPLLSFEPPPAIVWAPLIESIKCYFMPK